MTRNVLLLIVAIVLFLVGVGLLIFDDTPDPTLLEGLLLGGLAAFAASFIPAPAR